MKPWPRGGDLRVGPLSPIPQLLREAGLRPAVVMARCGLKVAIFDNPETRIPFESAALLIHECAKTTLRPDFGLLIGQRFDFASMGVIAALMQQSPTVGAALQNLLRYFHLHDRGAVPYLSDQGKDRVALGYAVYDHATPGVALVYDVAIAIACGMLRALCGPRWKPIRVTFAHKRPADAGPHRRFFNAPVSFNAVHSEIQFDAHYLSARIAGADAAAHAAVQRAADASENGIQCCAERTRSAVQALVMTESLTGSRVAHLLCMHERALRRHLRAEGTSLQAIVNDVRFETARQLLRETNLHLQDIAEALKYSEATAFSRAFRAWAKCTPGEWRAAARLSTALA